ncbi:LADA_0G11012g1_1 [Lachancea dasiensis]|uniref:LADA_0G11012g1_1 n=1 Tax=Lachancea dasiensis TaxID=1072105 RepID=A0A1G4JUV6_9SACH|nr:LADA_0G11012g1_1 [Lachancea dasiensis]
MSEAISSLVVLFPNVNESVLEKTLESANGDVGVACNMILSEQEALCHSNEDELTNEVLPVEAETKDSRKTENTSRSPNLGPVNLKKRLYRPIHSFEKLQPTGCLSNKAANTKAWNASADHIREIVEHTDVPKNIAQIAYHKQALNPARAIIDIIYHFSSHVFRVEAPTSQSGGPESTTAYPSTSILGVGGRVQSTRGLAHRKDMNFGFKERSNEQGDEAHNRLDTKELDKDKGDSESLIRASYELNLTIASNPPLKAINPLFWKTALRFYRGDILRTTLVGSYILNNNSSQYTFIDAVAKQTSSGFPESTTGTKKNVTSKLRPPSSTSDKQSISQSSFDTKDKYARALQIFDDLFNTHSADLHGFYPQEAKAVAQACLETWWEEEISLREINADRARLIRAQNIAPIKIITGRGLHSVGGISKVRNTIKSFLDQYNYVYTEEASYFVVEGRRTVKLPTRSR